MTEHDDELDPHEAAALSTLRQPSAPPRELEEETARRLAARGLLRGRPRLPAYRLAAAAVLLASGFGLGRAWPVRPASGPEGPRWLLLLEGGSPASRGEESARVAEYGAWARALASRGDLVVAEKLSRGELRLERGGDGAIGVAPGEGVSPSGFFLVRAADEESALDVARACPHLAHGGRVVVRRVEETQRPRNPR